MRLLERKLDGGCGRHLTIRGETKMLNQCEFDFGWNGLQIEGRAQSMGSGKWIESLRKERRIKSKDVERMSRAIAESKGDHNFYIPHSTLCRHRDRRDSKYSQVV